VQLGVLGLMKQSVVVFAYHNVGIVGIQCLLQAGFTIRLVVTHQDNPLENIWFDSVAELAKSLDIPVIMPDDPNQHEVQKQLNKLRPRWIFSFYYRYMLGKDILSIPASGAYNLHGSLLPKYRGRAPVNWAVLHGESETGVTLHQMVEKPDAGAIVDQESIPIAINDTAHDVFLKLAPAAETLLARCLPKMLDGSFVLESMDLARGSYFSGRKPKDGSIDWKNPAWSIHNLIRAVAPPYPGAFFAYQGLTIFLLGSCFKNELVSSGGNPGRASIYLENGHFYADCVDGKRFGILQLTIDDKPMDQAGFKAVFVSERIFL
jgi:methionyl-tRNA formyltransferase